MSILFIIPTLFFFYADLFFTTGIIPSNIFLATLFNWPAMDPLCYYTFLFLNKQVTILFPLSEHRQISSVKTKTYLGWVIKKNRINPKQFCSNLWQLLSCITLLAGFTVPKPVLVLLFPAFSGLLLGTHRNLRGTVIWWKSEIPTFQHHFHP